MNAISIQPSIPVQQPTAQKNAQITGEEVKFALLLGQCKDTNGCADTQKSVSLDSMKDVLMELASLLEQQEAIPKGEQLLTNPDVLQLLNELPSELGNALKDLLSSEMSLKEIIENSDENGMMLAALSMMIKYTESGQVVQQPIKQAINTLWTNLSIMLNQQPKLKQSNMQLHNLLNRLVDLLPKELNKTSTPGQPAKQMMLPFGKVSTFAQQMTVNESSKTKTAQPISQVTVSKETSNETVRWSPVHFQQAMPKLQQFVLHVQSQEGTTGNQELAKQFEQILSRSQFSQMADGKAQMTIKLRPEHLGSLNIELIKDNGILTARLLASSTTAKELIESQLHQLKQAFISQNILVEKLEIQTQAQGTPYKQFSEQQSMNQGSQQHFEQEEQDQSQPDSKEFSETFEEFLLNLNA